jgi:magnesium chelatase subunit D
VTATPYPFSALVGQEDLVLALSLNAVSPAASAASVSGSGRTRRRVTYSPDRYTSSAAVARTTPPWKPPPGVRWPWATT